MDKKTAVQVRFDGRLDDTLRAVAQAGFRYVSIGFGSYEGFARGDRKEEIAALAETLADLGLTCVMTHSPYYDLRISAEVTYPKIDISVARCLEASAMLGAPIMA
ncbi:MAG: hypothetical protein K6D94_12345, partial [Clostridiales bacterium]|nr:hypothetical protein [Clostridiales bacterium]